MANISSSTVFTNESIPSGSSDLLQQAFQQVVDDDDQANEFVAFLQSDENDSQTIHLTPEQAMALGITFEVNPNEEVTFQQVEDNNGCILQDNLIEENHSMVHDQASLSPSNTISLEHLSFPTKENQKNVINELVKSDEINFEEWHVQDIPHGVDMQEQNFESNLNLSGKYLQKQINCTQKIDVPSNNDAIQEAQTLILNQSRLHNINTNDIQIQSSTSNDIQFTNEHGIIRNHQFDTVSSPEAQILQKLPILLPSSQIIVKPTQTILKSTKNIRLLQNSTKITNNIGPINAIHSINNNSNPNSILISKGTMVNNLQPQIIKAAPITTQFINANGLSTQLLNTSHILAGNCQITSQTINPAQISNTVLNSVSGTPQNIISAPIRLSSLVKTSQPTSFKGNVQQFLTPISKTSNIIPKTSQMITNSSNTSIVSTKFLKSIQIPSQTLKSSTGTGKKGQTVTTGKSTLKINPSIIIRSSHVKTQDAKSANTNTTSSVLKSTQNTSSVSILKPQIKLAFKSPNKQSININSQLVGNITNNLPNFSQKSISQLSNTSENAIKLQNGINQQKHTAISNGISNKVQKKLRSTLATIIKPQGVTMEVTGITKSLGSDENPASEDHSIQRLTQSQLKQIAHALQQRNQETSSSNEKVIYRVVFPEELDLRTRSSGNLVKSRSGGKRGRPKKNAIKSPLSPKPSPVPGEEQEDNKDERKKVVARTRSGRLSRPPRHMVRDYKHLHHLDFSQPDLDDSDGGYSDYNTNDKLDDEESSKNLLTGLEVPKRKISDHFRCPTCNKIYLGRTRMARHFEMHPDHGSPEQLPPSTPEPELKQNSGQDPLKRKGKKRGPWAYVTPEAKSERRQIKLKEAISVCENLEIIKIATQPVLNAQSLFDLLVVKSENNAKNFLNELKQFMNKVREKTGAMLTLAGDEEECHDDFIEISEELLCDALGLNPGVYKINNEALKKVEEPEISADYTNKEPPIKIQKINRLEDAKESIEERMSSGVSESSDLSVSDFMNERRNDSLNNPRTCPEVLSALTLMRRNSTLVNNIQTNKATNSVSKLLISNPEIQSQISDNPGFQKVDISSSKRSNFQNLETTKENYKPLESTSNSACTQSFSKTENNYDSKLESLQQAFIKLEPMEQGFVKLESENNSTYQNEGSHNFTKVKNGMESITTGTQNFTKEFQKLVSEMIPMTNKDLNTIKMQKQSVSITTPKIVTTSICKITNGLEDSVTMMSTSCDNSIFENSENFDINKITQYDHMTHLDILNSSTTIDKNLLMDDKLVEQLQLVNQSNLVDDLVPDRLKSIRTNNVLETNPGVDTQADFEMVTKDFKKSTIS